MTAMRFGWVCLAGGLGSGLRYLIGSLVAERIPVAFPIGTLAVNLLGSALLAALVCASLETDAVSPELRIALGAGFLGGFTTYSAFSVETLALLQEGAWGLASGYAAVTVFGCLAACLLGQSAARWLVGG